ncbi:hypothetical protein DCAR_0205794 [Daucus carota subsp. sativus]|uniref:Uncharacterized protein n=1 Tax=Daucus carota subsp. sativus TaxID=79200 RepID=A0A166CTL8_DAUCS|nr:hypothetical protein DCAR_0205794 [Daucus carota subsp. sativus]
MEDFERAYEICVNSYEVALALYPTNAELPKLHELSKRLMGGTLKEKNKVVDDSSFVPSFSLGLSQVTPKKLVDVMDGVDNAGGESEVEAN